MLLIRWKNIKDVEPPLSYAVLQHVARSKPKAVGKKLNRSQMGGYQAYSQCMIMYLPDFDMVTHLSSNGILGRFI